MTETAEENVTATVVAQPLMRNPGMHARKETGSAKIRARKSRSAKIRARKSRSAGARKREWKSANFKVQTRARERKRRRAARTREERKIARAQLCLMVVLFNYSN